MTVPIPPGVFDILPQPQDPWRSSHLWSYVESIAREVARCYGFQEIRTPIFERTELFARSVGETTDIVTKEMYTFTDRGDRSLTLRPEGTASAIRALIEGQPFSQSTIQKVFYIGPMFRYERQQAGRYRQHHQFGVEAIGSGAPEQDAEVIDMLYSLYDRLGLRDLTVNLNSIGDMQSRMAFRDALKEYLSQHYAQLSEDSKVRLEKNPLRILDSKDPQDQAICKAAPSILDFLNEESRDHFESVKNLLNSLEIPYVVNPCLVRGLDYYNKTVFEITSGALGAQNTIGGGGRYDGLIRSLGGPDLPAMGFGTGIERIIQTMLKQEAPIPGRYAPDVFLIPLGEEAKEPCFKILHGLRRQGISAAMDFTGRKLNKLMQYADHIKAKYVIVLGENELKQDALELKNMGTGEKKTLPLSELYKKELYV